MQELARLGERVAAMVRDLDDPDEIKEIARREARFMLTRLADMTVGGRP